MGYIIDKNSLIERAQKHTFNVSVGYAEEISQCIRESIVYDTAPPQISENIAEIRLIKSTTTDALFQLRKDYGPDKKICLLNFADYKMPGGRFLQGAYAQEEALCHDSFLYNILKEIPDYYEWNSEHLNYGLYMNRAIYSPNVRFFRGADTVLSDVVTCAAPNRRALEKNSEKDINNDAVLSNRIAFVKSIIYEHNVDIAILGAWGCGVFGQDPVKVSRDFIWDDGAIANDLVVHAVPDSKIYNVFLESLEFIRCLPF